jgi:hypothetical protein
MSSSRQLMTEQMLKSDNCSGLSPCKHSSVDCKSENSPQCKHSAAINGVIEPWELSLAHIGITFYMIHMLEHHASTYIFFRSNIARLCFPATVGRDVSRG